MIRCMPDVLRLSAVRRNKSAGQKKALASSQGLFEFILRA